MKKTYINPEMEVVKLQIHQHLLDGSLNSMAEEGGDVDVIDEQLPSGTEGEARGFGYGFEFD